MMEGTQSVYRAWRAYPLNERLVHSPRVLSAGIAIVLALGAASPALAKNGQELAGLWDGPTGGKDITILCDDQYTGKKQTCAVPAPGNGGSQGVAYNVGNIVGTLNILQPGEIVEQNVTIKGMTHGGFVGGIVGNETFVDVYLTTKDGKGGKPSEKVRVDNIRSRIVNNGFDPTQKLRSQSFPCGAVTWKYDNKTGDACQTQLNAASNSFAGFNNLGFFIGLSDADAGVPGAMEGTVCNGRQLICEPLPPVTNAALEGITPMLWAHTPGTGIAWSW